MGAIQAALFFITLIFYLWSFSTRLHRQQELYVWGTGVVSMTLYIAIQLSFYEVNSFDISMYIVALIAGWIITHSIWVQWIMELHEGKWK